MPFPVGCYRKMAPSKVQCCEVIMLHYQSKSLKIVARGIRKRHPKLGTFDTNKVQRIVEESGSIEDIRHANTEQILDIIFSQNGITKTRPCNILQFFTAVKKISSKHGLWVHVRTAPERPRLLVHVRTASLRRF